VNLTDILKAANPFQQKAAPKVTFNNPFTDFGGLIGGRTLYPELDQQKFVLDYLYLTIKTIVRYMLSSNVSLKLFLLFLSMFIK